MAKAAKKSSVKSKSREKAPSILDLIRKKVKNSGGSNRSMFYVKDGEKKRVRFLSDAEDALQVTFHDKWGETNTPCLEYYGKNCPYCDRDDMRTRDNFAWSVYNYDSKEVEVFIFKANDSSPIPNLLAMYDAYGTLLDRDYMIVRVGEKLDTSYSVVPMDKKSFKKKVKPFSDEQIFELLRKMFDVDALDESEVDDDGWEEDDDEEEDDEPPFDVDEDEDEDDDDGWEDDDDEDDDDEEEEEEEEEPPKKKKKAAPKKKK